MPVTEVLTDSSIPENQYQLSVYHPNSKRYIILFSTFPSLFFFFLGWGHDYVKQWKLSAAVTTENKK